MSYTDNHHITHDCIRKFVTNFSLTQKLKTGNSWSMTVKNNEFPKIGWNNSAHNYNN